MSIPSDIILSLNQKAKQKESSGQSIINGTIGMMCADDGTLPIPPLIKEILSKHTTDADLCYSSVAGDDSFQQVVLEWFFGNGLDDLRKAGFLGCLGTIGGTGAVAASIKASSKNNSILLIPSLCWPNYQSIALQYSIPFYYYGLFQGNSIDLEGLQKQIDQVASDHRNLSLIINDPCENPTGYCMSEDEWERLICILNNASKKTNISLIMDCAYLDYGKPDSKRIISNSLKNLTMELLLIYVCPFQKPYPSMVSE